MEKLIRDVFVNVIANLVAAAILYLLATGVGALPRDTSLQLTASTSVVGLLGRLAWAYWGRKIGRERLAVVSLCIPAGVYIVLAGAVFPNDARPWWLAAANIVGGGSIVLLGLWLAMRYDRRGRHTRRAGST